MKFCLVLFLAASAAAVEPEANESSARRLPASNHGVQSGSFTEVADFEIPATCGYVFDDPHAFTYDGARNDCQGTGDYVQSKSLDSDFEVQSRYTKGTEWAIKETMKEKGWVLGTANKAIVINTGNPNEPVIEISADVAHGENGLGGVQGCALNYFADGVQQTLSADDLIGGNVVFQRRHNEQKQVWSDKTQKRHNRNFFFKDSGIFVQVEKGFWSNYYDCFLNFRICIPDDIKDQNLVGVLGNANGNDKDDYNTLLGTPANPQGWTDQQAFCKDNFCVPSADESLFQKPDIEETCEAKLDNTLEELIDDVSDEIKELCQNDRDCITDTIVTGDIEVGLRTLEDKTRKDDPVDPAEPATPEDDEEEDICQTVEGHTVPCEVYDGSFNCEALGFDFGFKMDKCQPTGDGPFQNLDKTDETPTCAVGNYNIGHFDIDCANPDGDSFKDAIITPSVDTVVKVRGENGGTLYTDIKAGETYTLQTGKDSAYDAISQVEFCFKCPSHVVGSELVKCAADVKPCEGVSDVHRDPTNQCAFPECPAPETRTIDDEMTPKSAPGTKGDPHFKTHSGEMYDFHGGCDMVLLDNPTYKNGLGLTIHIRTKIETWWSYVESAVIKMGDETLEIAGGDQGDWIWLNGAANGELGVGEWSKSTFAGNLLRLKQTPGIVNRREAHIHLGNGEKILLKSFNTFLKVEFIKESEDTLGGSSGLLGTYPAGKRVGRDGESLIEDVNVFGQEWQVTAEEPKLFHSYSDAWVVPAGQKCAMPTETVAKQALRKRRLANGIPMEDAEKACAHLTDASDHKACVFDVIATQDENMAGAW